MIDPTTVIAILERAKARVEGYRDGALSELEACYAVRVAACSLLEIADYDACDIHEPDPMSLDDINALLDVLAAQSATH